MTRWKHLDGQSLSPRLENCIKGAKTPSMRGSKQAACLLLECSNTFRTLVLPKLDYFELCRMLKLVLLV